MILAFANVYSLEIIFVTGNFSRACFPDVTRKNCYTTLPHYTPRI